MKKYINISAIVIVATALLSFSVVQLRGYKKLANENETRTITIPSDLAYGANGKFNYKNRFTGTITFNNQTFGDAAPGVVKAGYAKPYEYACQEGGNLNFDIPIVAAYGADGRYAYKFGVFGRVNFNNATFGDSYPGKVKAGYYKPFVIAGAEGESVYIRGTADVAYGANGKFVVKNNVSGNIKFDNATFGDPTPGVKKIGYVNYH